VVGVTDPNGRILGFLDRATLLEYAIPSKLVTMEVSAE
jgi:hypothetical protein